MADKPIFSIRVEQSIASYIHERSKQYDTYSTEVFKTLLRVGMEHTKETNEKLKEKQELAIERMKFQEADEALKNEMKKAYLVRNFKSLSHKLSMEFDKRKDKDKVKNMLDSMLKRIEHVMGKDSTDFKEAKAWHKKTMNGFQ